MYERLKKVFNLVGVIDKTRYDNYEKEEHLKDVSSIFVVGLAYPKITLKQQDDKLVGSIYTYGYDYHSVIKKIASEALKGYEYTILVVINGLDEGGCLELKGLVFLEKKD